MQYFRKRHQIYQTFPIKNKKAQEKEIKMEIRNICESDREEITNMMAVFYASAAVHTNGSMEIFTADIDAAISSIPYLEGYIIEENGSTAGFSFVAKSFSTEFGKPCIWIEDIYIKDEYRGKGFGTSFMKFIIDKYPNAVIRLEAEKENERAVHVYEKCGFEVIPYMEMIKL